MKKYIANPIEVEAVKIIEVGRPNSNDGAIPVVTEDGMTRRAYPRMIARYTPVVGDYWYTSEGADYVLSADQFSRYFQEVEADETETKPEDQSQPQSQQTDPSSPSPSGIGLLEGAEEVEAEEEVVDETTGERKKNKRKR